MDLDTYVGGLLGQHRTDVEVCLAANPAEAARAAAPLRRTSEDESGHRLRLHTPVLAGTDKATSHVARKQNLGVLYSAEDSHADVMSGEVDKTEHLQVAHVVYQASHP